MKVNAVVTYTVSYEAEIEIDVHDVTDFKFPITTSCDNNELPDLFEEIIYMNEEVLEQLPIPEEKVNGDISATYIENSFEIKRFFIETI